MHDRVSQDADSNQNYQVLRAFGHEAHVIVSSEQTVRGSAVFDGDTVGKIEGFVDVVPAPAVG